MTDVITTIAAIGIDLGDKEAHYACLNEEGTFSEEGTVATAPAGLRKRFAKLPRTRIAIEAGAQSRWIARTLGEFGHEVIVANPRQLPLISANISKNDSNDAKLLARLALVDPSLLSPLRTQGRERANHLTYNSGSGTTGENSRCIDAQLAQYAEGIWGPLAARNQRSVFAALQEQGSRGTPAAPGRHLHSGTIPNATDR